LARARQEQQSASTSPTKATRKTTGRSHARLPENLAGSIDPSSYARFAPLVINPGQTAVINVTIVPEGSAGAVVSGNLYVDVLTASVPPNATVAGDQLAAIPYSFTIR